MNRSHFVLAAAVVFALLAVVDWLRGAEPQAPVAIAVAPAEEAAPQLPPVAASPPGGTPGTAREISVTGRVTSSEGARIPGVRISVTGGRADAAVTEVTGRYALRIELGSSQQPALRFFADGYRDARVELEPASLSGDAATLDVRLVPESGAVLSGTVRSERGGTLAGLTVQLQAPASTGRYSAVTNESGGFSIPGVAPGPGYHITVRPESGYGDYQGSIAIEPERTSVDIALRPLLAERLRGRLVDTQGNPIPGIPFSIVSGQAIGQRIRAESDSHGYFEVDDVPTGFLSFHTEGPVELVISGVRLLPGGSEDLVLRADWGSENLLGRVIDEAGKPVRGAEVELSWTHVSEQGTGRSNRQLVTDASGAFRFDRLGAGVHRLDVRAAGYSDAELDYDVSSQSPGIEIEVEAVGPAA